MTANNELLSALVDGELQGEALAQALDLLAKDPQAMQQFQRYQSASDVLHGYHAEIPNMTLSNRISLAVQDEPSFSSQTEKKSNIINFPKQFWQQASQFALAASVGAFAVIGVMSQSPDTTSLPMMAEVTQPTIQLAEKAKYNNNQAMSDDEFEDRLDAYLSDHNEYAGASGVFTYARLVSY